MVLLYNIFFRMRVFHESNGCSTIVLHGDGSAVYYRRTDKGNPINQYGGQFDRRPAVALDFENYDSKSLGSIS